MLYGKIKSCLIVLNVAHFIIGSFFLSVKVLADFLNRIDEVHVNGKINDLYLELNKWSFESKFIFYITCFLNIYLQLIRCMLVYLMIKYFRNDSIINDSNLFPAPAICYVLYDKRFGILQENANEEATDFITAIKTVCRLSP